MACPSELKRWDCNDVLHWLIHTGHTSYLGAFALANVGGDALCQLDKPEDRERTAQKMVAQLAENERKHHSQTDVQEQAGTLFPPSIQSLEGTSPVLIGWVAGTT